MTFARENYRTRQDSGLSGPVFIARHHQSKYLDLGASIQHIAGKAEFA
jgi:hypothetical protein